MMAQNKWRKRLYRNQEASGLSVEEYCRSIGMGTQTFERLTERYETPKFQDWAPPEKRQQMRNWTDPERILIAAEEAGYWRWGK